jgi:hypothetical protein
MLLFTIPENPTMSLTEETPPHYNFNFSSLSSTNLPQFLNENERERERERERENENKKKMICQSSMTHSTHTPIIATVSLKEPSSRYNFRHRSRFPKEESFEYFDFDDDLNYVPHRPSRPKKSKANPEVITLSDDEEVRDEPIIGNTITFTRGKIVQILIFIFILTSNLSNERNSI